jgi:hypothetical protein
MVVTDPKRLRNCGDAPTQLSFIMVMTSSMFSQRQEPESGG